MKAVKKLVVMVIAVIGLLSTQEVVAKAEAYLYEDKLENATYDLALCVQLGETDARVYYRKQCDDVDTTIDEIFNFSNIGMIDTGEKSMDYQIFNLYQVSWSEESFDWTISCFYVDITLEYRESAIETVLAKQTVDQLIKNNRHILKDLNDAEKYEWIYQVAIDLLEYDYTLENDSVYEAIYSKDATCVGYTLFYYLMATEMGLPCKIAYGEADGGNHVWNLAELDGKWYYVDATWGEDDYDGYLLKAKKNVKTHISEIKKNP